MAPPPLASAPLACTTSLSWRPSSPLRTTEVRTAAERRATDSTRSASSGSGTSPSTQPDTAVDRCRSRCSVAPRRCIGGGVGGEHANMGVPAARSEAQLRGGDGGRDAVDAAVGLRGRDGLRRARGLQGARRDAQEAPRDGAQLERERPVHTGGRRQDARDRRGASSAARSAGAVGWRQRACLAGVRCDGPALCLQRCDGGRGPPVHLLRARGCCSQSACSGATTSIQPRPSSAMPLSARAARKAGRKRCGQNRRGVATTEACSKQGAGKRGVCRRTPIYPPIVQ